MSIDRMEKKPKFPHSYFHDLESLFYVMCWTCTLYSGPRSMKREFSSPELSYLDTAIAKWNGDAGNNSSFDQLVTAKVYSAGGSRLDTTIGEFAPYFDNIKRFAIDVGDLIFIHLNLTTRKLEELEDKKKGLDKLFKAASPEEKERMKGEYDTLPIQMRPASVSINTVLAIVDRALSNMTEEEIIPNAVEEVDGSDDIKPRLVWDRERSVSPRPPCDFLSDNTGELRPPWLRSGQSWSRGGPSMGSLTDGSSAPSRKRKSIEESGGSHSSKRGRSILTPETPISSGSAKPLGKVPNMKGKTKPKVTEPRIAGSSSNFKSPMSKSGLDNSYP